MIVEKAYRSTTSKSDIFFIFFCKEFSNLLKIKGIPSFKCFSLQPISNRFLKKFGRISGLEPIVTSKRAFALAPKKDGHQNIYCNSTLGRSAFNKTFLGIMFNKNYWMRCFKKALGFRKSFDVFLKIKKVNNHLVKCNYD